MTLNAFKHIEPLKEYDKQAYMYAYLAICDMIEDAPERPQDMMSVEEYDIFCRVVEAEIGIGSFSDKTHVANVIINRYYSDNFPDSFIEVLKQKSKDGVYQFSTIGNKSYKKIVVSESTKLSIEYAFLFGDSTNGATYFCLEDDGWHGENLELIFKDNYHYFFKEKQNE